MEKIKELIKSDIKENAQIMKDPLTWIIYFAVMYILIHFKLLE